MSKLTPGTRKLSWQQVVAGVCVFMSVAAASEIGAQQITHADHYGTRG